MNESIGQRIGLVIENTVGKKVRFAERINVDQSYVTRMVTGGKIPSDRVIRDICEEFNVNEHWLRTGEGEMFSRPPNDAQAIAARVAREYGSDPLLRAFMTSYLQLDDAKRALVLEVVESFTAALTDALRSGQPAPDFTDHIRARADVLDAARAQEPPAAETKSS